MLALSMDVINAKLNTHRVPTSTHPNTQLFFGDTNLSNQKKNDKMGYTVGLPRLSRSSVTVAAAITCL